MTTLALVEPSFLIPGPAGQLEVTTLSPKGKRPEGLSVICHPHSLMGGSLHNKVVHTIARAHRDAGHLAVRFNFRSVGKSEGQYDKGIGESQDLLSVTTWARGQVQAGKFYLAGFSFGAYVAARTADALAQSGFAPDHLLLVAPPVHHFDFEALHRFACPVTVIMGESDEVVPPSDVYVWCDRVESPLALHRVPGAGHFFHGRLHDLTDIIGPLIT